MLLLLLVVLSVPLGVFCAWFAYRAFKVGKRDTGMTFSALAAACWLTAGAFGGWLLMLLASR